MILAWITQNFGNRYYQYLIAALMIGICYTVFFFYAEKLSVSAERELVNQTISIMRRGLQIHMFNQMITGEKIDYRKFANGNPMNFLDSTPANYIGESREADIADRKPGFWFFDLDAKELVYRPLYKKSLRSPKKHELRLAIVFQPDKPNINSVALLEKERAAK